MDNKQAIAIVGIGGIFPGANDLNGFWENILAARDCSREPPKDRWLLSVDDVYDPNGPQPDKVYSKRACFVEDVQFDKAGLDIADELLASLDPVFHLLLYAGKRAWQDAITKNLRRERVGVVIGNIVLPTDSSSAIADEVLLPVFEQQITGKTSAVRATNKLNRYVAGLPAGDRIYATVAGAGLSNDKGLSRITPKRRYAKVRHSCKGRRTRWGAYCPIYSPLSFLRKQESTSGKVERNCPE